MVASTYLLGLGIVISDGPAVSYYKYTCIAAFGLPSLTDYCDYHGTTKPTASATTMTKLRYRKTTPTSTTAVLLLLLLLLLLQPLRLKVLRPLHPHSPHRIEPPFLTPLLPPNYHLEHGTYHPPSIHNALPLWVSQAFSLGAISHTNHQPRCDKHPERCQRHSPSSGTCVTS